MTPAAALLVWLLEALAIAALAATARGARVALALALVLLPYPFFVEGPAWIRLMLAVAAFWCLVRGADFAFEPAPARFASRFAHLFAIVDTRLVSRGAVPLPAATVAVFVLSIALTWLAAWAYLAIGKPASGAEMLMRWLAGLVLLVAAFELVTTSFAIGTALAGLRAPPVSDAPHLARSVAEFWSARWNRVVGKVLRDRVFSPLARRGRSFAIWATFAASAAFHAYLLWAALGWGPAVSSASFFLLQPPLLGLERRLRMRERSAAAQRAWTIGMLGLLSPLFVEPLLRVLDSTVR